MEILTLITDEAAGAAITRRLSFLALAAFSFGRSGHLEKDVSDVEQMVYEESTLQTWDSALWETAKLVTVGALDGPFLCALAH